jgi:hypothetical protein
MSFQAPITIAQALDGVHQRRYLLPAIQREFVWSTTQIEQLFDSLMRGYPIGSFLFWQVAPDRVNDYQYYEFIRDYHERDRRHNVKASVAGLNGLTAVLDGQQRLTSLYIAMYGSYAYRTRGRWAAIDDNYPKRQLYLDLLEDDDDWDGGYRFRFLTEAEAKADEGKWFRVGAIMDLATIVDLNRELRDRGLADVDHASTALFTLFEVVRVRPLVNFYLETSQDLDTVLNIFIRVNSGGTPLSYSDLLLSVATAQWKQLDAREEITALVDTQNARNMADGGYRFDRDFVLKACLVLADVSSVAFKVTNFTQSNMGLIESRWPDITRALTLAVDLVASFGLTGSSLRSNNAVIPIAYYLIDRKHDAGYVTTGHSAEDRSRIRRWLLAVLLKGTFGAQGDYILGLHRSVIKETIGDFPFEVISDRLAATYRSLKFADDEIEILLDLRYGRQLTPVVLGVLYPGINWTVQYHYDHLHPRSHFTSRALEDRGVTGEDSAWARTHVDDLANLTVIEGWENVEKSDKPLAQWLAGRPEEQLRGIIDRHRIPPDVSLDEGDFAEFHRARRVLLRRYLTDLLNSGLVSEQEGRLDAIEDALPHADAVGAPESGDDIRLTLLTRVRDELIRAATERGVLTYAELGTRVAIDLDDPAARTVLSSILGEISEAEVRAGRPMLSAIVVQTDNQAPGAGFYALGQRLGVVNAGEDADSFAFRQMRAIWENPPVGAH